jgi:hypothetical protein
VAVQALVAQPTIELSINAFSTGLPGQMNSRRTSCAYAQASIARVTNSLPLSTVIAVGAQRARYSFPI